MTPEKLWKEAPIVKSVEATTVMSAQHMQDMPHHPGPLHVGVVVLLGEKRPWHRVQQQTALTRMQGQSALIPKVDHNVQCIAVRPPAWLWFLLDPIPVIGSVAVSLHGSALESALFVRIQWN